MKYSFGRSILEDQNGATITETSCHNWNNKVSTNKTSKLKNSKTINVKPVGLIVEQSLDIQVLRHATKMTSCTQISISLRPYPLP